MKSHKHAELIKAWADGAIIQYKHFDNGWGDCECNIPSWNLNTEYRIKPETKPDIVKYALFFYDFNFDASVFYFLNDNQKDANLKITIDAETGKLKHAEVVK